MATKPVVEIEYCSKCRWLLRAAWYAQELLSTFENELERVSLRPNPDGGVFSIQLDDHLLWDRKRDDGFPEIKVLKQRVRDVIAPGLDLGHTDR